MDGFLIRGELVAPRAEVQFLSSEPVQGLIHEGNIDLNPPYQRDQALLIDSLFRNFWIPPVVFAVTMDEDGVPTRVCVDGKQRLTSIQRFMDGQLPYIQSKKQHFYFTAPESTKSSRLQIPDHIKKMFTDKQITCVEYSELTPAMEREIFQRVQLGMPLTTAEKLAAIDSPWAEWISKLESRHISIEGGLSQVLSWDTKRGREFQNVAQFVYCCDGYPDSENIPTAPKMESRLQWLARVDIPGEQFKQDIDAALTEFCHLAVDPSLNFGFNIGKKLAPVEFVFIAVLLYVLRKVTSLERAKAVYHLRTDIREEFLDVRMNNKVGAAMWKLINHLRYNPTTSISGASAASTSRRKRRMSDSDGEYRPSPIKSLGKGRQTRSRRD
ncbi:hypothetical protein DFH07DRAFT_868609 [Mycena maculata]|uniref:GmrSD restriction endonucleases N-terminal domain-containing protein n=1 Tax=Mycena maculata TaxID=230809 RepID=A0AAD7J274_9AGAR|nr:hypothetical protein DFH07DRAFT_868609 [Mycena maculata]